MPGWPCLGVLSDRATVFLDPPLSQSPVSLLLGSVCYIWCNSPVLSGVLCELMYLFYTVSLPGKLTENTFSFTATTWGIVTGER